MLTEDRLKYLENRFDKDELTQDEYRELVLFLFRMNMRLVLSLKDAIGTARNIQKKNEQLEEQKSIFIYHKEFDKNSGAK